MLVKLDDNHSFSDYQLNVLAKEELLEVNYSPEEILYMIACSHVSIVPVFIEDRILYIDHPKAY